MELNFLTFEPHVFDFDFEFQWNSGQCHSNFQACTDFEAYQVSQKLEVQMIERQLIYMYRNGNEIGHRE